MSSLRNVISKYDKEQLNALLPPGWRFDLYHFHKLVDSEENARQKMMAARFPGDCGCVMSLQLCLATGPAYPVLWL